MDKLPDDLLLEICRRLPHKDAVRSRFISKRFLALISHHISHHILHHHNLLRHMNHEDRQKHWHLHPLSRRKLLLLFHPSNPPQTQLSLGFIGPDYDGPTTKKRPNYSRIVGCSNGLLLIRKSERERLYFVCNPLTTDSLKLLPLPPFPHLPLGFQRNDRVFEGLVCEPHYRVEEDGNRARVRVRVSLHLHGHRFRVVRFPLFAETSTEFRRGAAKSEFEMVVFSSETGQWTTKLVSCTNGSSFVQADILVPAVALGWKLYFVGRVSLLVYDPFGDDTHCDVIDYPSDSNRGYIPFTGHVGVSCGSIRLCNLSFSAELCRSVSVWELKQGTNDWRLLHRTSVPAQDVASSVRPELVEGAEMHEVVGFGTRVRAFHPHHGDVVLFQFAHRLFFGNLKTNRFRTAGYGTHRFYDLQVISLDLPWWPTPLPSITYAKSAGPV